MTCREKLKIEHPEYECTDRYIDPWPGCPHEYGYVPMLTDNECHAISCVACWDRELPNDVDELLEENRDLRKKLEEKEIENGDLKNALRRARVTTSMYRLMYNRLETRLDTLGKIMSEMERKLEDSKE